RGVDVVSPAPATFAQLAQAGISVEPTRIVDLTLAGARYEIIKGALGTLLAAPEFDLVISVVGSSARTQPEAAAPPIVDRAGVAKPLVAFLTPEAPEALVRLMQAGVPNFRTPESCADAVAAALRRRAPRPREARHRHAAGGRALDDLAAYGLLDRIGIARAP